MAKKRKVSRNTRPTGPREVDVADARLGPINSYEDVADSQDKYFMNQDKIMLEDERTTRRQKRREEEDAFLENSDDEVYSYGNDDDDNDDMESEEDEKLAKSKRGKKGRDDDEEEIEGDERWWGSSKKEYYNADNIETEADALEEEAEAKRLQHKKLAKMADEDFMFDEDEWKTTEAEQADGEVITEVLGNEPVPDDITPEESMRLLKTRYPEFEYLATEFEELKPVLEELQQKTVGKGNKSLEMVQYIVLASYLAALASYFAILTSPARDSSDAIKVISPSDLRDHEVMNALFKCRDMWTRVRDIQTAAALMTAQEEGTDEEEEEEKEIASPLGSDDYNSDNEVFYTPNDAVAPSKKATKSGLSVNKAVEDDLADLYNMPFKKLSKKKKVAEAYSESEGEGDASDFGEEEALDEKAAAEKARRKKSLRFYTSQIVQKSSRRADASRDAGGDMDIPYRERLKDRQARLNAEAEKRGKKFGADLDDRDSDEEDAKARREVNKDEEYYNMVAGASKKKREVKSERYAAYEKMGAADRVVEVEEIDKDGKRKITYSIEKNKGLAPKRKKENRNPRVKKRMKYEEKMKKLKSMKPTYAGPGQSGYQGIKTGIKAGLIKSTKFQN